ncbi:MAG: cache domain-containing protein, partial [Desulforhopalus sp.]
DYCTFTLSKRKTWVKVMNTPPNNHTFSPPYSFYDRLSLKAKLVLCVLPIAMLGLLTLSFTAYYYINNVIEKQLAESMLHSVGKSAESINRWLSTIMIEPETIAATPAAKQINENFAAFDRQNINRHKSLHKKYSDIFQDIYAANRHGEYHTVIEKDGTYSLFVGNIANRPYFLSIMDGGSTQITPPLISRTTGIPTIFMVAPILDNKNRPQGLVGAGISLQYIQKVAQELKAGKTGFGFIISKDGTFIYHPESDLVMRKKISDMDSTSMVDLGKLMLGGGSGIFRYNQFGVNRVAFYHEIPITGWAVASVLNENELFAPAIRMMKILATLTVIAIVVIGIAILQIMSSLTKPLHTLSVRAKEIASGNLDGAALEVTSRDEIGILSTAFNTMVHNLKSTLSGLKESEQNYRSMFENAIEGILQTSYDGSILNANPAMAKILGFKNVEALKANVQVQTLYAYTTDRDKVLSHLLAFGSLHDFEVQALTNNNEKIWISLSAFLVRDDAGKPLQIESMIVNINDRKRAEQEREELFDRLGQSQKLEAVGQLAGGVAHDFNNMLSVILGQTELALLRSQPSDKFYKAFTEIRQAAEHSANLTGQLLAFARKQTTSPKVIDLRHNLNTAITLLRRLITEDIELNLTIADDLWKIHIDPDQLRQILTNLCVNARDAITGNGNIDIAFENVSLDKSYSKNSPDYQPGDYVCLSVRDSGCGMDETTKKHIFEPFFTTKEMHRGTGLGLSTVYGIVKQNYGFINIYSEPGEGTISRVYFPRHDEEPGREPLEEIFEAVSVDIGTVLLVEDEPSLLNIINEMLNEMGCHVLAVASPLEAIELASDPSYAIELLLTDVVMPEMNGKELATRIQAIRPEVKCLFMSGYTADIIAHKGVLEDGLNFINKPFSTQTLAKKILEITGTPPS